MSAVVPSKRFPSPHTPAALSAPLREPSCPHTLALSDGQGPILRLGTAKETETPCGGKMQRSDQESILLGHA